MVSRVKSSSSAELEEVIKEAECPDGDKLYGGEAVNPFLRLSLLKREKAMRKEM